MGVIFELICSFPNKKGYMGCYTYPSYTGFVCFPQLYPPETRTPLDANVIALNLFDEYIKTVENSNKKQAILARTINGKEACFRYILICFNQFKLFKFFICHVPQLFDYPIRQFRHICIIKVRQGSFNILYDLAPALSCIYAD